MQNRIVAALALACAVSFAALPAGAHPLVPGLAAPAKASKARSAPPRGGDVVALAERYIGTNPTKMRRLWCANFIGLMEKKVGRKGTGSNLARSYDRYGRKIARSEVRRGDIAVMRRGKRGGHVGYFVEWAPNGKAVLISGNSRGGKVAKGQYSVGRIYAWRRPG
ncbi:CHAP domain-containing protein [Hyphomonas sp.]|uniref:CHAP domain-containing protein n=1 Tax=Hyphomonas sp. TaxID=87 RepID=UPI0025C5D922|nr:CHAP domain-containing protein [Hyphomonas sp.]